MLIVSLYLVNTDHSSSHCDRPRGVRLETQSILTDLFATEMRWLGFEPLLRTCSLRSQNLSMLQIQVCIPEFIAYSRHAIRGRSWD
ncbi:hypothetical protein SAMN05421752_10321 [Natronorubrum thiooxidans]|uniref:Uncharacterized protein n=1 Tax=Natronorubrum thiooxidans TaxID=308853 RepID=A0A1N7DXY1_9EURY|nr:hypothetical protein SAMN05421752_10321 [Natronorubrum thiooxidans]